MPAFVLRPAGPYLPEGPGAPHGLGRLVAEAAAAGIRNVAAVVDRWADGSERYDAPGEALLVAIDGEQGDVIGVGGLSRCPHVAGALRVRRFYVVAAWRRRGVARAIAQELIDLGERGADVLTCNARASAAAPLFWDAMGFEPVTIDGITHIRR